METLFLDILEKLKSNTELDQACLEQAIRTYNKNRTPDMPIGAKKHLLPFCFATKKTNEAKWLSWGITEELEKRLISVLRMKPGRTASGVATVTVLTKPWPCAHACLYCPNDIRMPKSYLADEPACQRAERSYFDPYLQVAARLRTLRDMGHVIDKVELIILGGTWTDYPVSYQYWFMSELFRALNDMENDERLVKQMELRRSRYQELNLPCTPDECITYCSKENDQISQGLSTYNEAVKHLYGSGSLWDTVSATQVSTQQELDMLQHINETASSRAVGLVVETRPDALNEHTLLLLRHMGCTKIQMGIQSLRDDILLANNRHAGFKQIVEAFELLRLFGFKSHVHYMINLYGATPQTDIEDFETLTHDPAFLPDELKLYPCALVDQTGLMDCYNAGSWQPYTEEELIDVLSTCLLTTPPYLRISRMIRDISAHDIVVGNKKVNLRQLVETESLARAQATSQPIQEIRLREIRLSDKADQLSLQEIHYDTTVTREVFLQWVTQENKIAGFLRLSLPNQKAVELRQDVLPVKLGEAMIREVHVYGQVAAIHQTHGAAQHTGLGKMLIERACELAKDSGYERINVISSVGTRQYYRQVGFADAGLYQQRTL
ncbi:tRNA uridine(34) 5-carboxymethylaminomethyl modification radical SAM/GNAT enzyme Elp3 [Eggerthellaceae bacterium 3-80]|nr:tRNA uridine(34) 5-carboxymethylaminomethyl modification radical SAM/GNAT enzyme Elp3 [bacterium D16-34]